jgi:hypothetical protein
MKKLPEAIACYQKAIKLDPRFEAAFVNLKIAIDKIISSEETLEETFMVSTWGSGFENNNKYG